MGMGNCVFGNVELDSFHLMEFQPQKKSPKKRVRPDEHTDSLTPNDCQTKDFNSFWENDEKRVRYKAG